MTYCDVNLLAKDYRFREVFRRRQSFHESKSPFKIMARDFFFFVYAFGKFFSLHLNFLIDIEWFRWVITKLNVILRFVFSFILPHYRKISRQSWLPTPRSCIIKQHEMEFARNCSTGKEAKKVILLSLVRFDATINIINIISSLSI